MIIVISNLAHSSKIRLYISDILGRPFLTLYQGILGEGLHRIPFQTTDLLSGIYFYTFTVDGVSVSKKLMIIKN